jgi:hypothetical protein
MKSIFVTLIVFSAFTVNPIFGQNSVTKQTEVCTEETIKKISSRGISLGMSQEETLNLLAENGRLTAVSSEYLQNEGRNKYSFIEAEYQNVSNSLKNRSAQLFGFSSTALAPKDKTKFDGIDYYDLGFLDNSLAFFRVYYTKPKWENREQFIRKMSEILNLPVREDYLNNSPYSLECGNHKVQLGESNSNTGINHTMLVSTDIDKTIAERRKKADDEQREKDIKTFKP